MPAITFSQSGKERLVWNPAVNKTCAEFINGQFTTGDEDVQKLLFGLGYKEAPAEVEQGSSAAYAGGSPLQKPPKLEVPSSEAGGAAVDEEQPARKRKQTAFINQDEINAAGEKRNASVRPQPAAPKKAAAPKRQK